MLTSPIDVVTVVDAGRNKFGVRQGSVLSPFLFAIYLGHRLGDDLVDWNSGVSVRSRDKIQILAIFNNF